ncbi:hypothetical protein VIGAN_UM162900, partial [Vigna angularis var. angularis]
MVVCIQNVTPIAFFNLVSNPKPCCFQDVPFLLLPSHSNLLAILHQKSSIATLHSSTVHTIFLPSNQHRFPQSIEQHKKKKVRTES